jgi:hypothetical protein
MRHPTLALAVIVAALFACKSSDPELSNAKLGTLQGSLGSYTLKAEASRLPLVPGTSGDVSKVFGICFHYTQKEKLGEISILVTPPGAIDTSSVQLEKEKVGNGVRMKVDGMTGSSGDFCQEMFFEAGDPAGKWRFELQRDQKTVKSFDVDVYAP